MITERYQNLFGVNEIRQSPQLQAIYWILLTGFFLSFSQWIKLDSVTLQTAAEGRHVCLPWFQNCEALYFFHGEPLSYGQNTFYAFLAGIILASALAAWRERWALAHVLLLPPLLWKITYVALLTHSAQVDFEYFHIPPLLVFLFARHKLFFLRRSWVLVYLLAATMKFNESWIVGNYFTSLSLGMPWVPNALVPWITNAVALFEIISPWLLLSANKNLRYGSLALWILFHLYSILLVDFRYPLHCTPLLLALFLPQPQENESKPLFGRAHAFGWLLMAALFIVGLLPRLIPGDKLYTLQGIKFGVGMFDANHQCVSEAQIQFASGETRSLTEPSGSGMSRCGPYPIFFRMKQRCEKEGVTAIRWTFLSSVNGGPFYKLVDTANACALEYKPFGRNDWILDPGSGATLAGYPAKNTHGRDKTKNRDLVHEEPSIELSPLQLFLQRNLGAIALLWWVLWGSVLLLFTARAMRR